MPPRARTGWPRPHSPHSSPLCTGRLIRASPHSPSRHVPASLSCSRSVRPAVARHPAYRPCRLLCTASLQTAPNRCLLQFCRQDKAASAPAQERFAFEKGRVRGGGRAARPELIGKNHVVSVKRQAVWSATQPVVNCKGSRGRPHRGYVRQDAATSAQGGQNWVWQAAATPIATACHTGSSLLPFRMGRITSSGTACGRGGL